MIIIIIIIIIYNAVLNPKPFVMVLVLVSLWLATSSTEYVTEVKRYKEGEVEVREVKEVEKIVRCNHTRKLKEFGGSTAFKMLIDMLGLQIKVKQEKRQEVIQKMSLGKHLMEWLTIDYNEYKSWKDGVRLVAKVGLFIVIPIFALVGSVTIGRKLKE